MGVAMQKKFFVAFSLFIFSFPYVSYGFDVQEMKEQIEETKAKHFSKRNNGIRGDRLYIYRDFRMKRNRINVDKNSELNIFEVNVSGDRLRQRKVKVRNITKDVNIEIRGRFRSGRRSKEKNIYSIDLDNYNHNINEVIMVNKNANIELMGK